VSRRSSVSKAGRGETLQGLQARTALMKIFDNTNYDFIRWRWQALILAALLILAGIGYGVIRGGIPLGIDFTGGTLIVVRFSQPVAEDAVRKALDALPGEKVVQKYGEGSSNEILTPFPQVSGREG